MPMSSNQLPIAIKIHRTENNIQYITEAALIVPKIRIKNLLLYNLLANLSVLEVWDQKNGLDIIAKPTRVEYLLLNNVIGAMVHTQMYGIQLSIRNIVE